MTRSGTVGPISSRTTKSRPAVLVADADRRDLIADLDREILRQWQERARERGAGFEIGQWEGRYPEEDIDAIVTDLDQSLVGDGEALAVVVDGPLELALAAAYLSAPEVEGGLPRSRGETARQLPRGRRGISPSPARPRPKRKN